MLTTRAGRTLRVGSAKRVNRYAPAVAGTPVGIDNLTRIALKSMDAFTTWLSTNNVPGYLGETGWPHTTDRAAWEKIGAAIYARADAANLWVTQWATGDVWSQTYPLLAYSGIPVNTPRSSAAVLEAHLGTANALRGVNVAGGEFKQAGFAAGTPGVYGTDFSYGSAATYTYLASRGLTLVRIPFHWERLQPTLGGPLDTTQLGYLTTAIGYAAAAGLKVVIDCHNYGGYVLANGTLARIGSADVTVAQFADLWARLAAAYRDNAAVIAYGLMNEAQGLPAPGAAYLTPTTRYSFDTDAVGWSTTHGAAWSAEHGGSMRITAPTSGTSTELDTSLRDRRSGGLSFWADIYLPANAVGTWDVALQARDASYGFLRTEFTRLLKGQSTRLRLTLTDAQAANLRNLELSWGGAGRNGTDYAYVQSITQGTYTANGTPVDQWILASQAAVDAVRGTGDATEICVLPYVIDGQQPWGVTHTAPWISGTGIRYEYHLYYDWPAAGHYTDSYATDLAAAPA